MRLSEANGIGKTLTAEGYTGNVRENQNILYHDHGGNYRNYIFVKTINCTLKKDKFYFIKLYFKCSLKKIIKHIMGNTLYINQRKY